MKPIPTWPKYEIHRLPTNGAIGTLRLITTVPGKGLVKVEYAYNQVQVAHQLAAKRLKEKATQTVWNLLQNQPA